MGNSSSDENRVQRLSALIPRYSSSRGPELKVHHGGNLYSKIAATWLSRDSVRELRCPFAVVGSDKKNDQVKIGRKFCFTWNVSQAQNRAYAMKSVGMKGNHENPTHPTPVFGDTQCDPE